MVKLNKSSIIEAAKHLNLWRKIYNALCSECKYKVVKVKFQRRRGGTEEAIDDMQYVLDNDLCEVCQGKVDDLIQKKEKKRKRE